MDPHSRPQAGVILALALISSAFAAPAIGTGDPVPRTDAELEALGGSEREAPEKSEPKAVHGPGPRAPQLPILATAFRRQVERELGNLPDGDRTTTEDLEAFSALVLRSERLADVARASYLEWVAHVYLGRRDPARALERARQAFDLRKAALGPTHPMCLETIDFMKSIRVRPRTRGAEAPVQVPRVDHTDGSFLLYWELVRVAVASWEPEQVEPDITDLSDADLSASDLSDGEPSSPSMAASPDVPSNDGSPDPVSRVRRLVAPHTPGEAESLVRALSDLERSRTSTEHPATLLLTDLLFASGKLKECSSRLSGMRFTNSLSEQLSIRWRRARLACSWENSSRSQLEFSEANVALAELLKPDHPEAMLSRHEQAEADLAAGNTEEALRRAREVGGQRARVLGAMHRDTLDSKRLAARASALAGHHEEARAELIQLAITCRVMLGDHDPLTLHVVLDLACTLSEGPHFNRDQAESSSRFAMVISGYSAIYGTNDVRTLAAKSALAHHRIREGRPSAASFILLRVVEARRNRLGEKHPDTLASLRDLAAVLEDLGRSLEAREIHAEFLRRSAE